MRINFSKSRSFIIVGSLIAGIAVGSIGFGPTVASAVSDNNKSHVFAKNKKGQTYGSFFNADTPETLPDLTAAIGDNGKKGYVLTEDLQGPQPNTPEEAIEYMKKRPKTKKIKLYAEDGETVIGTFTIHNTEPKIVK